MRMSLPWSYYQSCIRSEIDKVGNILIQVQQKAYGEEAKEVARLRGYLMENFFGLSDYQLEVNGNGRRGLGAREGNMRLRFPNLSSSAHTPSSAFPIAISLASAYFPHSSPRLGTCVVGFDLAPKAKSS